MLRSTRSNRALGDDSNKSSTGTKRKTKNSVDDLDDLENLPSPPTSPTKRRTVNLSKPETPQNIRNITRELQLAQLKSPSKSTVYLKSKSSSNNINSSSGKETLYQKAKTVFRRTAVPSRLIGRGDEREQMLNFWKQHVLENKPGCLYVSGMPGTGKTAMLTEVMRRTEDETMALRTHRVNTSVINCMSVREPKQIYVKLIEGLSPTPVKIQLDAVKQAEQLINSKKNILNVVILDEIDSLITKDQEVLYKIFEWASLPTSRLVLIGIANALDLTDRILPRLRAKNCEPQLLNFNPYQVSEITSIIKDRLFSLIEDPENPFCPATPKEGTAPPLIQTNAIELCARKVAASMGDLRTALDVCRQAIELAEMEQKKRTATSSVLGEQKNNSTAIVPPMDPKVTIAHVMKVLNVVFGSPIVQKLKQLNLQQKIVLGVLLVMIRSNKTNKKDALTIGKFREQYSTLCSDSSTAISTVSRTELNDLLSLLETTSIITLGKSKEDRSRKIQLNVQESEITQMINDMPILKNWMDGIVQKNGY